MRDLFPGISPGFSRLQYEKQLLKVIKNLGTRLTYAPFYLDMADEGDQGGGDDPRMEMLKHFCLKTMKQVT